MRMTVSLCVIMVEISNNLKFLPLIMLVLLISKVSQHIYVFFHFMDIRESFLFIKTLQAVGDAFNEGLYEEQAQLRGIPLLESRPKYQMRKITAREACGKRVILPLETPFVYNLVLSNPGKNVSLERMSKKYAILSK